MTLNLDVPTQSNRPSPPKLDDAESIILIAAANRKDGIALPVPESITAPADRVARKIKRLIKLSLLAEVPAKLEDGLWRKSADDRHLTLKITPLAFDVLGLDVSESLKPASDRAADASTRTVTVPASKETAKPLARSNEEKKTTRKQSPRHSQKPENSSKPRKTSKTETLLGLLGRSKGASLDELMKATAWQAHSVRGFLSAVVKKKLRLKLLSEEDNKGVRRYRVKPRAKV